MSGESSAQIMEYRNYCNILAIGGVGVNVGVNVDVIDAVYGAVSGVVSGAVDDAVSDAVNDAVGDAVTLAKMQRLSKELLFLILNNGVKSSGLVKVFQLESKTVERDLKILGNAGLVNFEGAPKTGKYVVTEKVKQIKVKIKKG